MLSSVVPEYEVDTTYAYRIGGRIVSSVVDPARYPKLLVRGLIGPGDAFAIPPGHDAEVTGNEPCVSLDFGEFGDHAKRTCFPDHIALEAAGLSE
jgi:hypothetical protein